MSSRQLKPIAPVVGNPGRLSPEWRLLAQHLLVVVPYTDAAEALPVWTRNGWTLLPKDGSASTQTVGERGPAVQHGANGYAGDTGLGLFPTAWGPPWSTVSVLYHDTSFYDKRTLLTMGDSAGDDVLVRLDHANSDCLNVNMQGTIVTGGAAPEGAEYVVATTYDGTTLVGFINGVQVLSSAVSFSGGGAKTYLRLGREYFTGDQAGNCLFSANYVFDIALTADQVQRIADDPFGLIRPAPLPFAYAPPVLAAMPRLMLLGVG
jgi:hypothetical protein